MAAIDGQQITYRRYRTMTGAFNPAGLRGKLMLNESLSRHTSWRVGGPADRFYVPADLDDLRNFLRQLPEDEPLTWMGLGSNLLIRDGGIRGTVIATKNVLDDMEWMAPGQLRAGSGIFCARLAKQTVNAGYSGAEFMIGIPGTLGGALAMNAGAFGSETWNLVRQVVTLDRKGNEFIRSRSEFTVAYRSVSGRAGEWFVAADLELQPDTAGTAAGTMREFLSRRSQTQPVGEPSCGSVFRNPGQGVYAARLIEDCGLKGFSIGQAAVSTKHANFIINQGGASAAEIEQLIHYVQQTVQSRYTVSLEPEVRIVGDYQT